MASVFFDRDSLIFTARRLVSEVEIEAQFQALKVSNPDEGLRFYSVTLIIDPDTRGVRGTNWCLQRGRDYSSYFSYEGGKDKLRSLEKQIRDEVLKSPAWDILAQRGPDPNYVVDETGAIVMRARIHRRV
jgi:hypothetical protein